MKTINLFLLLIMLGSVANAQEVTPNPGNGLKKMSLCNLQLIAGVRTSNVVGIAGAAYDEIKNEHDRPYYAMLEDTMKVIVIDGLRNNAVFELTESSGVPSVPNEKAKNMATAAQEKNLFACLSIQTSPAIAMGWNKKVCMYTNWKITTSTGYSTTIKTNSVSEERMGVFPDVGDPKLKPVWLDLQKENVKQFLGLLKKEMEKNKKLQ